MKTIKIEDIKDSEIQLLTDSGCKFIGMDGSYGSIGVFEIPQKKMSQVKSNFSDRIKS